MLDDIIVFVVITKSAVSFWSEKSNAVETNVLHWGHWITDTEVDFCTHGLYGQNRKNAGKELGGSDDRAVHLTMATV